MPYFGYLVVEGQHDIAFIGRLLRQFGFTSPVQLKSNVDLFWNRIIPTEFPVNDDLMARVPVPTFFQKDTHSIAIHAALGITNIVRTLNRSYLSLETQPESYGILLDADNEGQAPKQRFDSILSELHTQHINLPIPLNPGDVAGENPAFGIYVLPDNQNPGTLENILLQTAQVNYTNLASTALTYIQSIDPSQLTPEDLREYQKPAGQKKAQIGSMASVLRPGAAIQVSIQRDRWLEGESLNLPAVKAISVFLATLLQLA